MSKTSNDRIVLEGRASQRVPGFSLYMTWMGQGQIGYPPQDLLFEFAGAKRTSSDPFDYPDEKYDIFISTSTMSREGKEKVDERKRKLFCSNVTPKEAVEKIRECVLSKYRDYVPEEPPPSWWAPVKPAELQQIRVHNFMRMDSTRIQMQQLLDMYDKDRYVAGLCYPGVRVKAHFWNREDQPRVRFDTMAKDTEGIYQEVTAPLASIGMNSAGVAREWAGTILDGYVVHPKGQTAVGLVLGMNQDEAFAWMLENGIVQYVATDILRVRDEWLTKKRWIERQKVLGDLISAWQEHLKPVSGDGMVAHAPYWTGPDKRVIRSWAINSGYEGVRLIMTDGTYNFNGRSWEHVLDLAAHRYYVLVTGYVNATDTRHGPLGMVDKFKVGQYDESGVLLDVGFVDPWDETSREIISSERERWMGRVLEVESVGYTKGTNTLIKARLIGLQIAKRPEHCLFNVTTEAIGD